MTYETYDKFHEMIHREEPVFTEETYLHLFDNESPIIPSEVESDPEYEYDPRFQIEEQNDVESRYRYELEMRYLPDHFLD